MSNTVIKRIRPLLFALAIGLVPAISATSVSAAKLDATQQEALSGINKYFNSVRTMEGDFVQFGPNGERAEGQFFISRPGKVRFFYKPPSRINIVADGKSVSVFDRKLRTQDIWPLGKTPLRFLVADSIDLQKNSNVQRVEVESDLVTVVIEEKSTFGKGKLTLVFDAKTKELKQWTITDAQGLDTSVAIYNVTVGKPANAKNFKINYALSRNKRLTE
ncbi:MAG: outer-membrane lipoprotein carrier protein LolA [Stappiaceae bacterium]